MVVATQEQGLAAEVFAEETAVALRCYLRPLFVAPLQQVEYPPRHLPRRSPKTLSDCRGGAVSSSARLPLACR